MLVPTRDTIATSDMSRVMRKPNFCLCEEGGGGVAPGGKLVPGSHKRCELGHTVNVATCSTLTPVSIANKVQERQLHMHTYKHHFPI